MKTKLQKTRLAVLAILGVIIYVYMILSSFALGWDSFKAGFEEGSSLKMKTYFMKLKPIDGAIMFPDSIKNEVSGDMVKMRHSKIAVNANVLKEAFFPIFKYQILFALLMNVLLICNVIVPIVAFILFRSLSKEMIFTKKNIRYIRFIGYTLLTWFVVDWASSVVIYKINSTLFQFQNYEVARYEPLFYILLLGVITLIIAETFSRGVLLKEEQDLTI